jgi:hypothetical protein
VLSPRTRQRHVLAVAPDTNRAEMGRRPSRGSRDYRTSSPPTRMPASTPSTSYCISSTIRRSARHVGHRALGLRQVLLVGFAVLHGAPRRRRRRYLARNVRGTGTYLILHLVVVNIISDSSGHSFVRFQGSGQHRCRRSWIDRRGKVDGSLSALLAARLVDSVPVWSRSVKDSADVNSTSVNSRRR